MLLLEIIVVICFLLIVHSYVLFPIILKLASAHKSQNSEIYSLTDELPSVALLLAVYNEEEVIVEKILSTFKTNYPVSRLKFYIGSDASTDETNKLISKYANEYPIELVVFPGRTGKSGIINKLAEIAKEEILINPVVKKDGISFQEKTYLSRENLIKYQEGVLWGTMIGAFGGCYSIRAENYRPVPKNFLMDDFYISMNVIEQGKKAINELDAQCIEDVSNKIEEEFRRKVRISAGNFQNLNRYKSLLWPPFTGLSFCFLSHKVLRWYTPVLLLLAFICILIYIYLLFILIVLFASPLIDNSLKRLGLHIKVVRFATHFILMNFALLKGLIWYTKGVQTNVWQPTQRNQ
jgi:cellulose synthase/poly-beta-1,6-N-acetylglucosamine synthase-like glycosyltransferase